LNHGDTNSNTQYLDVTGGRFTITGYFKCGEGVRVTTNETASLNCNTRYWEKGVGQSVNANPNGNQEFNNQCLLTEWDRDNR
jgi:hypothetical protein